MKRAKVDNEEDLAEAMEQLEDRDIDEIEISGNLKDQVVEIKGKGSVVWGIVAACFAVAAIALLTAPSTGGISGIVAGPACVPAVAAIGTGGCTMLAKLICAAGSVDIMDDLYENTYIAKETKKKVILRLKD